ncbi:non-ribosomal peptide synthetase [Brevibacillus fulvus]|uniref:Amino acid adenylation domain-containing protein n=1 Tax=Brevibacillus fulvus TaxID=1125967 RepID=A0A938XSN2_9BACL|nr:amino acid adenylation domain-containing protein [Brevibacillus fulvus]MBM7589673.1 amino acid adenylation domain-containing protein [Brevibacillus fulvus]
MVEYDMQDWREWFATREYLETLPFEQNRKSAEAFQPEWKTVRFPLDRRQCESQADSLLLAAYLILLYRYSEQPAIFVVLPDSYVRAELGHATTCQQLIEFVQTKRSENADKPKHSVDEILPLVYGADSTDSDQRRPFLGFQILGEAKADLPHCKLVWHVRWSASELNIDLLFDAALFAAEDIARMPVHYYNILNEMMLAPERKVSELSLLSRQERELILVEWNQTEKAYPQQKLVHELVEQQAERYPALPAVCYDGEMLTYEELNRRANQLAHYLLERGIHTETPVGVCMDRCLDQIVSLLAVLKAGGVYLPLDPQYPSERLHYMLEAVQAPVVITRHAQPMQLSFEAANMIELEQVWPKIRQQYPATNLTGKAAPANSAYLIFTSGSTGKPKASACTHTSVVNLLSDLADRMPLSLGDACSLWSSFSFDVSIYEIFTALSEGGTLHIVPNNRIRYDSNRLFRWMQQHQIKSAYLPPFMLGDFNDWLAQPGNHSDLERLAVGVESIWEPLLVEIEQKLGKVKIFNIYGPSECTIYSTLGLLDSANSKPRNFPIGKPIANTRVYILDSQMNPVPIGISGELYIGGVPLGKGYVNNPSLTAEKFVPDPFSQGGTGRLYKTGDRARFLADGTIEFLGRTDYQVKIRGHRVEPGEVETVLKQHQAVRNAAVVAVPSEGTTMHLVAHVVPKSPLLTSEEIFRFLRGRLPSYMIPSRLVVCESLPLNPNGKLDRKALMQT